MKVVILYRPKSEHGTKVESFVRDVKMRYPTAKIELNNVDSREGMAMSSIYDIMRYPAILALAGDGAMLQMWEGDQLPLMNDVAYYLVG